MSSYAELTCLSNHTFLTGASHPEELVERAHELGLKALALTDRDGLYGIVKAHLACREVGMKLLVGSELTFEDAPRITFIVQDLAGYKNLCRLITRARTARPKGEASLPFAALEGHTEGLFALLRFPHAETAQQLKNLFGEQLRLAVMRHLCAGDEQTLQEMVALGRALEVPLVAVNDVHTHRPERQPLQDVLVCIREKTCLEQAGRRLFGNAERTLKSPAEMEALFADLPEAVANTVQLADACTFQLDEIAYQFPAEDLPADHTPESWLRELSFAGAKKRYAGEIPPAVAAQIERELELIEELGYPGYFLTLWTIVEFARSRGILCQGRGSAANSIVCYCLGITAIDPVRMDLLFERFMSRERNEPPDIDVDFEHERREEVLQHIYEKYGRDRAAMVCEVISYKGRSAVRDTGKALGLSLDQVDKLASAASPFEVEVPSPQDVASLGLDPEDRAVQLTLQLAKELLGFPRHLSIHTGGFAITRGPLYDLVPVENGAMEGRTVVQWDKDDVAAAGILKVDLLSLGMLSAMAKTMRAVGEIEGKPLELATIPPEDPVTYDMLSDADTVGVFQIESRAQMNMGMSLRPRTFYDLVIQVGIIRPGPIIGGMVPPFLRRRHGIAPVIYPHPVFKPILERTLGVTLFQEQIMRLAVEAAGFTLGEADNLRRAMGHKRSHEKLMALKERFIVGLGRLGLTRDQGEAIFAQFEGFSHYGFPESHSASYALLAYASGWLKRYHPAAFACGLLNSQPMGFYAPHTLIEDARRHGVPARPVDVQVSDYDCTLEKLETPVTPVSPHAPREQWLAVRLGMRLVRGLREDAARHLEAERRKRGPFTSLYDLWRRTHLSRADLSRLAAADALRALLPEGASRREALWHVHALPTDEGDLFARVQPPPEPSPQLPALSRRETVLSDYHMTGTSLLAHPMELMRESLRNAGVLDSRQVAKARRGKPVTLAGLAIIRQRPGTAKGMCFITLEDEHGFVNVVITPDVYERYRRTIRTSLFLLVHGKIERAGKVTNVKTSRVEELKLGDDLAVSTRDFH